MITIIIPPQFEPERRYTLDILLGEILELDYTIKTKPQKHTHIILPNNKKIIIKDHFFSILPPNRNYLRADHIPRTVPHGQNRFIKTKNIPIIYGTLQMEVSDKQITSGLDLISSAFFMLTRWEEHVNPTRDSHQRFPATASLAYKHHFLDRPIVNEYAQMLQHMLQYLGYGRKSPPNPFQFHLTHDIDALLKWLSWTHVLRTATGDILKRRQIPTALSRITEYRNIRNGKQKDPYDHYQWLMDIAEKINTKAHFYFMSGGLSQSPYDNRSPYKPNHPATRRIIEKIKERNHIIGFHPGYDSQDNPQSWKKQKDKLEQITNQPLTTGRQHYLRFTVPHTWQLWEDHNMTTDSTCGYADREGFRCGTGHTYSVFNILTRKKLKLKEQPLIFMDKRNFTCGGHKADSQLENQLPAIIAAAKNARTPITLLFHNATFAEQTYIEMYQNILASGGQGGAFLKNCPPLDPP